MGTLSRMSIRCSIATRRGSCLTIWFCPIQIRSGLGGGRSALDWDGRPEAANSTGTTVDAPAAAPSVAQQGRIVARIEELANRIAEVKHLRFESSKAATALVTAGAATIVDQLSAERLPLWQVVSIRGGGTPAKDMPHYWADRSRGSTPKDMKRDELYDSVGPSHRGSDSRLGKGFFSRAERYSSSFGERFSRGLSRLQCCGSTA